MCMQNKGRIRANIRETSSTKQRPARAQNTQHAETSICSYKLHKCSVLATETKTCSLDAAAERQRAVTNMQCTQRGRWRISKANTLRRQRGPCCLCCCSRWRNWKCDPLSRCWCFHLKRWKCRPPIAQLAGNKIVVMSSGHRLTEAGASRRGRGDVKDNEGAPT